MSEPIKVDLTGPCTINWTPDCNIHSPLRWKIWEEAINKGVEVYERRYMGHAGQDPDQIKKKIKETFPHLKFIRAAWNDKGSFEGWILTGPQTYASIYFNGDQGFGGSSYTFDKKEDDQWVNFMTPLCPEEKTEGGAVFMAMSNGGGLSFKMVGVGGVPLERDNYTDEVLATYDKVLEGIQMEKPRGRLNILNGPPGSGKSFYVRGLLNDADRTVFVFIQPGMVQALGEASVLPALMDFRRQHDNKPITFIVEDADDILATRGGDNMSSISALLNFGDGILGSLVDVRFICTTNAKKQELDRAILRAGRLNVHAEVGKIGAFQATKVLSKLLGKPSVVKEATTIAEVYQMAYDADWRGVAEKAPVGFSKSLSEEVFGDKTE